MDKYIDWLRVINPAVVRRLGHIRHALFDFDGTLSVLRRGWEPVMEAVMVEAICGDKPLTHELEQEVQDYIDRSTGILTILQMQWLEETVRRHGLVAHPLNAAEYKALYLERLMKTVNQRVARVEGGQLFPEEMMIVGTKAFLTDLGEYGIHLYAASGTDHSDLVHEVKVLGLTPFFAGAVYGALDVIEAHSKERIIQRILDENHLAGDALLVVGDGPVELREAHARGAIALGVASDEVVRWGWNQKKVLRLVDAGADLLVADFEHHNELTSFLLGK